MALRRTTRTAATLLAVSIAVSTAHAQERPRPSVEAIAGYAGFVDEALIDHTVIGGAARVYLRPWLAVGPEVVYMVGPGDDRDLFVTGNVTFDLLPPRGPTPRAVAPYLVVGAGLMRHSDRFLRGTFSSSEGAFTAGAGVRLNFGDRLYVAPEYRVGWEPHFRIAVSIGYRFGGS